YVGFPSPWAPTRARLSAPEVSELRATMGNEIVAEVAPQPGDLVLEKSAPSAFGGTPLDYHLTYLKVDSLIVCGETTSGCIRATVVDGATRRYKVTVVEDCCFDRTEASHWINLLDMQLKYADVVSLETVIAMLAKRTTVDLANA